MFVSHVAPNSLYSVNASLMKSKWVHIRDNITTWADERYLMITIGALALGIIFAPATVPMGIAIGVGDFTLAVTLAIIVDKMKSETAQNEESEYVTDLISGRLLVTLVVPILEEVVFRGCIQPLMTRSLLYAIPTTAAAFLGTSVSVAMAISIVATAILFGAAHVRNKHKGANEQAVLTGIGGITLGLCAAQLGLLAAIAAHMIHNTIIMIIITIALAAKKYQSAPTPSL